MNITAKVIADSQIGMKRVLTLELEYPRFIHSELMTHRVFSRNAASSRAIPISKLIEQVQENTVMPIYTRNQKGMQGEVITNGTDIHKANQSWLRAMTCAVEYARELDAQGIHKQVANRILEPFQHIKTIVTATDWNNWFELRLHEDADPHIYELAKAMKTAIDDSEMKLTNNHHFPAVQGWHLPYVDSTTYHDIHEWLQDHCITVTQPDILFVAMLVSASCCAQVSYRALDTNVDKAIRIGRQLLFSYPPHASPFEHQCRYDHELLNLGNLTCMVQARHVWEALLQKCSDNLKAILDGGE